MKSKLVLWGSDASDSKVLVALELRPEDNKVDTWTFPARLVTDEFSRQMLHDWREDKDVVFPEGFTHTERNLTAANGLVPDDIKIDKPDLVQRAQTEWHFLVLSHKLNELYQSELNDMRDRVAKLSAYDQALWDELKNYWEKVREQVSNRNLLREQADSLRDAINTLFTDLKNLRSSVDDEFRQSSQSNYEKYAAMLTSIETRIAEQVNTSDIFEELKKVQGEFRAVQVARELRFQIWDRIDAAFKTVKEKRFGSSYTNESAGGTFAERVSRRYEGLVSAINKMQDSIVRDKEELVSQAQKMKSNALGQLETQILDAKLNMINTRIASKEEKLVEMHQTKADLEAQKNKATSRERFAAASEERAATESKLEAVEITAPTQAAPEMQAAASIEAAEAVVATPKMEAQEMAAETQAAPEVEVAATPEAVVATPKMEAQEMAVETQVAAKVEAAAEAIVATPKMQAQEMAVKTEEAAPEMEEAIVQIPKMTAAEMAIQTQQATAKMEFEAAQARNMPHPDDDDAAGLAF